MIANRPAIAYALYAAAILFIAAAVLYISFIHWGVLWAGKGMGVFGGVTIVEAGGVSFILWCCARWVMPIRRLDVALGVVALAVALFLVCVPMKFYID